MNKMSLAAVMFASFCTCAYASENHYNPDAGALRSTIPSKYKWNLRVLYPAVSDWNRAYSSVEKKMAALMRYDNRMDSPQRLAKCMDDYFDAKLNLKKVAMYAFLKNVEDQSVERFQKMYQRASDLERRFNVSTAFIRDFLIRLPDGELKRYLSYKPLRKYESFIKEIRRRKKHVLSPEAERIMAMFGDILFSPTWVESDVESVFKAVLRDLELPKIKDEKGREIQLTLANYAVYRASGSRRVCTTA